MKDRRPTGHYMHRTVSEASIDRRDETIRKLIDELVDGTKELQQLYKKEGGNDPQR